METVLFSFLLCHPVHYFTCKHCDTSSRHNHQQGMKPPWKAQVFYDIPDKVVPVDDGKLLELHGCLWVARYADVVPFFAFFSKHGRISPGMGSMWVCTASLFSISSHRKTRIYLALDTVEARMRSWLEVLSAAEILEVINDSEDGDRLLFAAESFAVWQVFWSVGGYWIAFILLGTNVCHFICSGFEFSEHCYIREVSVQPILKNSSTWLEHHLIFSRSLGEMSLIFGCTQKWQNSLCLLG